MNYMPDMAHFAFPRAAAGRLTIASLCAHFERVLPYTRLILRPKRQRKVWVDGRANGASVELVPISKQQRSGIVQANPTFAPAEDIVRLCSGPNHDYTYLPIFYDVELALLQVAGICRIYAEGEVRPLERMTDHFEWVAGRMAELSAKDDYDMIRTDIAAAMLRLTEAMPTISMSPEIAPWLLQGLLDSVDARADGVQAQLLAIRPPAVLPKLEEMLRDSTNELALPRLFNLYRALTEPSEGAADTLGAPHRSALTLAGENKDKNKSLDEDAWGRWITRYVLGCHDDPRPLIDALTEPSEAQALFELADMSFFIDRAQALPNFSPLLDDYIDRLIEGNDRFGDLLTAIAALLRERGEIWSKDRPFFPVETSDPASAELWTLASESGREDIRPPVRAIAALLSGDPEDPA